jgi:uncharacterized protein YdaU (DUF1376 family)
MADMPFMPLYTDALLGDTMHLDAEEFGVYCLILFTMWRNGGSLPDDDARLAKVARVNPAKWRKIGPVIRGFLTADGTGKLTQKRLAAELSQRLEQRAAAAERGAQGGRAKALKEKGGGLAGAMLEPQMRHSGEASPSIDRAYQARNQIPERGSLAALEGGTSREPPDDLAELRRRIGAVFDKLDRLPPETGHAATWIAAGYDPDLVVRVVEEVSARNPKVRSLRYFDEAIAEAHRSRPAAAKNPQWPLGIDPKAYVPMVKVWLLDPDKWQRPYWGPPPDEPGCIVPADVIARARAEWAERQRQRRRPSDPEESAIEQAPAR